MRVLAIYTISLKFCMLFCLNWPGSPTVWLEEVGLVGLGLWPSSSDLRVLTWFFSCVSYLRLRSSMLGGEWSSSLGTVDGGTSACAIE